MQCNYSERFFSINNCVVSASKCVFALDLVITFGYCQENSKKKNVVLLWNVCPHRASPPGVEPSVNTCILEMRDSSTSKWLSPSRKRYLRAKKQIKRERDSRQNRSHLKRWICGFYLWLLDKRQTMVSDISEESTLTRKVPPIIQGCKRL